MADRVDGAAPAWCVRATPWLTAPSLPA